MRKKISKTKRRLGVIVNYLSLIIVVILFYIVKHEGWHNLMITGMFAALLLTVITFITVHLKTGLWKFVHTKIEQLDEREIQVTHESLRYSYSILSVILLVIIFIMSLAATGNDVLGPVLPTSLIYLAHTLPSSVIAWTENEISHG
ncbi:MAG: hypothetical protein P9X24_10350 [Candidatus Hatepunaea meridiana]|nr:hypothetical protein [Candidatus Hatepunaea meridiana]